MTILHFLKSMVTFYLQWKSRLKSKSTLNISDYIVNAINILFRLSIKNLMTHCLNVKWLSKTIFIGTSGFVPCNQTMSLTHCNYASYQYFSAHMAER